MLRLLEDEVAEELSKREGDDRHRHVTIATGKAAAPSLEKHMQKIREKYPNVQAEVVTIINYFFGESITVSGLITGKDLMEQLEGRDLGDCLLLPCNMLRSGKNVFLDDVTVEEVEERLKTPVQIIDEPGSDLVKAVVEENQETIHRRRTMYEQADCSNCGTTFSVYFHIIQCPGRRDYFHCKRYTGCNKRPYLCGCNLVKLQFYTDRYRRY